MEPAASTESAIAPVVSPTVHPLFQELFPNADVTLLSSDGFLFPIASETLARVSEWFRTMFTIPQNPAGSPTTLNEAITMSESADILADLLSIVSGTALPQFHDVDRVETLLFTADKYDMPLPIAILRLVLPSLMKDHPIRVYGIACRMSWEAEAQEAAARTLAVNMLSPQNLLELRHVETSYVVKLLSLHERRRIQANEELDSAGTFVANTDGFCGGLCGEPCNRTSWAVFKLAWNREPWRFLAFENSVGRIEDIPELNAVLETKCKCGTKYYVASYTTQKLQTLARSLPKTIQWE